MTAIHDFRPATPQGILILGLRAADSVAPN